MALFLEQSRSEKEFFVGMKISVNDRMQTGYEYSLSEPMGHNFHPEFAPELTPVEMLALGVFEGKYLNDCTAEFPKEWYEEALRQNSLSPEKADPMVNCFHILSRQPLSVWREKGWILPDDPDVRGWFQWYCRYFLGRRNPVLDERQIKRWKNFRRHKGQILKNCPPKDLDCRPRQRQALLQWAYSPFF